MDGIDRRTPRDGLADDADRAGTGILQA
jgi:hypothetical protein